MSRGSIEDISVTLTCFPQLVTVLFGPRVREGGVLRPSYVIPRGCLGAIGNVFTPLRLG